MKNCCESKELVEVFMSNLNIIKGPTRVGSVIYQDSGPKLSQLLGKKLMSGCFGKKRKQGVNLNYREF